MPHSRFTPGVERILNLAHRLAAAASATEIETQHLLWALVLEESRGSEILHQHGFTRQSLPVNLPVESPAELPQEHEANDLPLSSELQDVIRAAELQAGRQGRYAELGSEHLLLGLAMTPSATADWLEHCGITADQLRSLIDEAEGHPDLPLSVDFQLNETQPVGEETDLFRILDAAANRVREGVRVLEDFVRFARDDAHISSLLKNWRHDLRSVLSQIDDHKLLRSRDTAGDVGTGLQTAGERHRGTVQDVLRANAKRVQEGLRTLEEFGKILSPDIGEALSQLRYRFYTIEKIFITHSRSEEQLADRTLYLLITQENCRLDPETTIRQAVDAGADIVQIREKTLSDRELLRYGRQVREWTRESNALLIMNDRPDLAVLIDADGVHVGQEELSVREARRIVGPDRLVGVSTHNLEQARQAVTEGADYLGVGPVFSSQTKSFSELAGLEYVRQVAEEISLPWFAIGGITPGNLPDLLEAGAERIAVSQAVCGADSPADVVTAFKAALAFSAEVSGESNGEGEAPAEPQK